MKPFTTKPLTLSFFYFRLQIYHFYHHHPKRYVAKTNKYRTMEHIFKFLYHFSDLIL